MLDPSPPTIDIGEVEGYSLPYGHRYRFVTNDNYDAVTTNDGCDDEVSYIANKLRQLHERRCNMLRRWSDPGGSIGDPPTLEDRGTWCPRGDPQTCDMTMKMCASSSPSPTQRMNHAMAKLRRELVSLFSQDNAIFEHLLVLRQSITQLKQQSYDDLYEDAEVTYLSSNAGSFRFRRDGSTRKPSTEGYSCFTPLEQNCEDSGISMVSSSLSSPSMSPSPTSAAAALQQLPAAGGAPEGPDPDFRSNNVTFPPSRTRQSRCGATSELANSKRSCVSTPSGVDTIGNCILSEFTKPLTTSGSRRSFAEAPPVLLVRSRSITFLPRGVLVRKETVADAGAASQPDDGEVFV